MRTNTLRCGYYNWNPAFIKDSNTGELRGIFHDYVEEMGRALKIKIEWVEEIGLADYPAALESGRIDAMCSSLYVTSERSRVTDFITPAYYVPLHLYVRADDMRFDGMSVAQLNDPAYTVAILEGGVTSIMQRYYLPLAKIHELPQLTSPAELFTSLADKKADFLLYDRFTFEDYNAHNPGRLRRLTTTTDLHLTGAIDRIVARYEVYADSFLRMAPPYISATQ